MTTTRDNEGLLWHLHVPFRSVWSLSIRDRRTQHTLCPVWAVDVSTWHSAGDEYNHHEMDATPSWCRRISCFETNAWRSLFLAFDFDLSDRNEADIGDTVESRCLYRKGNRTSIGLPSICETIGEEESWSRASTEEPEAKSDWSEISKANV